MLLALDTSTLHLSLALIERDGNGFRVREAVVEGPPHKQSERLPLIIHELLGRHGLGLKDLEALIVGLGPGSFTGLRIGMSSLKALSFAVQLPLCGASSLAATALLGPEGRTLIPISVVRKGELYVGRYRREGKQLTMLEPETTMTPVELAAALEQVPDACVLGPGVTDYGDALKAAGLAESKLSSDVPVPLAKELVWLAQIPSAYDAAATFALEPHYLKASSPELNPKFPVLPGPEAKARLKED